MRSSHDIEPLLPVTKGASQYAKFNVRKSTCPRLSIQPDEHHDRKEWQIKLGRALESHAVEWIIISLIFLDVVCVLFEILEHVSWLQETHTIETFLTVLTWLSRSILAIFAIEITLKIIAFGKEFLRHFWHCFDLFVIVVCIAVEITDGILSSGHHVNEAGSSGNTIATGLLVLYVCVLVFRFLRIVHVFHDLYEINRHFEEERVHDLLHEKDIEIAHLKMDLKRATG